LRTASTLIGNRHPGYNHPPAAARPGFRPVAVAAVFPEECWGARQNMSVTGKSQAEKEISQAIIRFEKEFMGRGPLNARTYIIDDLVLVRLKNVLTPAELKLAEAQSMERGRNLIKHMRQELIEQGRPMLDTVIKDILGISVVSLHTDISAKTGERIIVFSLAETPRFRE
jgi:uncharacterized protein YbcI